MKKVTAIFDIGKTNKKILLFDEQLQVVYQKEHKFQETTDDDGFECDDIVALERWMSGTLEQLADDNEYDVTYHKFMIDLTRMSIESFDLVLAKDDQSKNIYISGGFARNEIFVKIIATKYPDRKVYTSEVDNASALGAAILAWKEISQEKLPELDLGLKLWHPITN